MVVSFTVSTFCCCFCVRVKPRLLTELTRHTHLDRTVKDCCWGQPILYMEQEIWNMTFLNFLQVSNSYQVLSFIQLFTFCILQIM